MNKILQGISPSLEPDVALYNDILHDIKKFGLEKLLDSIERLLAKDDRKHNHNLSIFFAEPTLS